MEDEVLERNKSLNRGFRKLRVWREAIELYIFEKKVLSEIKGLSFKIRDQILDSVFSIHSILAQLNSLRVTCVLHLCSSKRERL